MKQTSIPSSSGGTIVLTKTGLIHKAGNNFSGKAAQVEAKNKKSSAMGIPQLLSSTWKNIKVKPTKNGYKQVDAGLLYLDRRYGNKGICRAYAHHLAKGWY